MPSCLPALLLLLAITPTTPTRVCNATAGPNDDRCATLSLQTLTNAAAEPVWFVARADKTSSAAGVLRKGTMLRETWREESARIQLDSRATEWPTAVTITVDDDNTRWQISLDAKEAAALRALYLPAGQFHVQIAANDFETVTTTIEAKPGLAPTIGRITLVAKPQTRGVVIDTVTKVPLQGVGVRDAEGKTLALTDHDGKFRFERPTAATKVQIVAPGYGTRYLAVPAGTGDYDLHTVQLTHGASLRVGITAAALRGDVLNIDLTQTGDTGFDRVHHEEIGKPGTVAWDAIEPGTYVLKASGKGPLQQTSQLLELKTSEEREVQIDIKPTALRFITRQGDTPAPNARITMSGKDFRAKFDTGPDGDVTQEIWDDGEFLVLAAASGATAAQPNVKTVTAGHDATWRFNLPSGKITGHVIDSDNGKGIAAGTVVLRSVVNGTDAIRSATTDERGAFEFSGLDTGTHSLAARATEYTDSDETSVILHDDTDLPPMVIRLTRATTHAVHVIGTDGSPVIGADVFATAANGDVRARARTGVNGDTSVALPALARTLIGLSPAGMGIAAASGDASQPILLQLLPPTSSIQVRTTLKDGAPLAGIAFKVRYAGHVIPAEVLARIERRQGVAFLTNDHGEASLGGIPQGQYELWPQGSATPVTVTAGPGVNEVHIVLDRK